MFVCSCCTSIIYFNLQSQSYIPWLNYLSWIIFNPHIRICLIRVATFCQEVLNPHGSYSRLFIVFSCWCDWVICYYKFFRFQPTECTYYSAFWWEYIGIKNALLLKFWLRPNGSFELFCFIFCFDIIKARQSNMTRDPLHEESSLSIL